MFRKGNINKNGKGKTKSIQGNVQDDLCWNIILKFSAHENIPRLTFYLHFWGKGLLYSHFHGRGKLFSMQLYASSRQLHFSWIWTLKLRLSLKQLELILCRALKMTRTTLKLSWREKSLRTTNSSGPCCHTDHLICSDHKRALHH